MHQPYRRVINGHGDVVKEVIFKIVVKNVNFEITDIALTKTSSILISYAFVCTFCLYDR